jgi:hypothetical protein
MHSQPPPLAKFYGTPERLLGTFETLPHLFILGNYSPRNKREQNAEDRLFNSSHGQEFVYEAVFNRESRRHTKLSNFSQASLHMLHACIVLWIAGKPQ